MPKKPVPVTLKSDKDQIASVQEEGVRICKQLGHLRNKHYNTAQNRVEFRCPRCNRFMGFKDIKEA